LECLLVDMNVLGGNVSSSAGGPSDVLVST